MTISPTQFLNAMATPGARVLHVNACTVLLQHLDRVKYPAEAELRVPLASLQDEPLIINGAVDSVILKSTDFLKKIKEVALGGCKTASKQFVSVI